MNGSDDAIICHNFTTHRGNEVWKCTVCQETVKEYEDMLALGGLEKILHDYGFDI